MLTKEKIKEVIPHREPMLLIDSVIEHEYGKKIKAKFYVDPEWDIFKGHFPNEPVFPGVFAVECMAQTSDVLLLSMHEYAGKTPFFIGIDKVRFKYKICPGDEIIIVSEITNINKQKAVVTCSAEIINNNISAVTGDVTLAMR